jgi:glycine dehydrogenase subunit 1
MHRFISISDGDYRKMCDDIGIKDASELFSDIPQEVLDRFTANLKHSELNGHGWSELKVTRELNSLAGKNLDSTGPCFLGAGAYNRFVPAVVDYVTSRSAFATAYTPYQAEVSQGTLQAIFEFQSIVCALSGMDVSNASHYDCSSAMAEAVLMSVAANRKPKVAVSRGVNPRRRNVVKTYASAADIEYIEFDLDENGRTVIDDALLLECSALVVQQPNFLGVIEDLDALKSRIPQKCHFDVAFDPISTGLLKTPGACGADIAVGEGLGCGLPVYSGGPALGYMAVSNKLMRKIPGRIVGRTKDVDGKDAFVLTLQAREQHIRRSQAASNICSNQALCALASTVYFSLLGAQGLKDMAHLEFHKAHEAKRLLLEKGGCEEVYETPFFNEFSVKLKKPVSEVNAHLLKSGIRGGYDLSSDYPELGNAMLVAVTELISSEDIEEFAAKVGEVNK